jgi:hypothetical protein
MKLYITGGDDCKFHTYDTRIGAKHPVSSSSVHEAGVTSLHSNALFEHLLASGRYAITPKFNILEFLVIVYLLCLLVALEVVKWVVHLIIKQHVSCVFMWYTNWGWGGVVIKALCY